MTAKIITIFYLISLLASLWMVSRYQIRLDNEQRLKKMLVVLFSGYLLAVTFIYVDTLRWEGPILFLSMVSFCPFVWLLIGILRRYGYKGDLGILILTVTLNSLGLVVLYRLDISSGWFLTRAVGYQGIIPMALKQLLYSMIALLGVVIGISRGYFKAVIEKIAERKDILIWGFIAFALLVLPKLFGFSAWLTQDKSLQPSEFAFKIIFLVFVSKYYESRSSEILLKHYPIKEVIKLVLFVFSGIVIFFFLPLVILQKELGTGLLIGLSFIILTAYVTNRFSFFMVGLVLIALAIYVGTQLSGHVEKRVIAAWLDWREYAFKPFREGEKLYPGYQIFTALAAIRMSPWGVGIGNGILKHTTMDKTIVPKAVHDFIAIPIAAEIGIMAIIIIGTGYFILLDKAMQKNRSLTFKNILAAGIATAFMTQGLYNLSSVIALLPATGIPLPWISYGGSAVFANYILIGLLSAILDDRENSRREE
ncbi:MAG: FtsW/RodA/SpoVE family cell cycle protein [Nitrospirota bacterium]